MDRLFLWDDSPGGNVEHIADSLAGVVARHSKEIDQYVQSHGPMTRQEVVEKALAKLLSDV